ncbi:hypothetical protein DFH27DRAFT_234903 [Peziza echinospora]|nr:hypothetical protein DFH27DRAFT_234903 [Peziza echinospora]
MMLLLQAFGLFLGSLQLVLGSPLAARQDEVGEVLNVLSSYNTASGDCGILLASKFSTETKRVTSTTIIKQPSTLSFTTITSTPKNQVTETAFDVEEIFKDVYTVVPGTYTTVAVEYVTAVSTTIEIVRVTALVEDPTSTITITKTDAYRENTVTAFVPVTTTVATTTIFTNPTPSALREFDSAAVTSACSAFINAPLAVPFQVIVLVSDLTTTVFDTTLVGTRTEIEDTTTLRVKTDSTHFLTYPRSEFTLITTRTATVFNPKTSISTLSLVRTTPHTVIITESVALGTVTSTVTLTTSVTKVVPVPAACQTPIPGSATFAFQNGVAKRVTGKTTSIRASCCAQCADTVGCAGFEWYALGDCILHVAEAVNSDDGSAGKASEHCPLGQLDGIFDNSVAGGLFGIGLCWN